MKIGDDQQCADRQRVMILAGINVHNSIDWLCTLSLLVLTVLVAIGVAHREKAGAIVQTRCLPYDQ